MLERNVGTAERVIRVGLGVLLVRSALGPFRARRRPGLLAAASALGAVLLVTGLTGRCPLYSVLGVSTYQG